VASRKSVIAFGMVSIPIAMYTATQDTDIRFNQLTEDIKRLLHLAGFSEDIYCSTNYGRSPHAF
jgi:hypothetical protein